MELERFNVEVEFAGVNGPPFRLPVWHRSADDALQLVKDSVRECLTSSAPAGGMEYTIGVFGRGCRAGDRSLAAERITMVTMPFADEIGAL